VRSQGELGQHRHPEAGDDQRLHGDVVVGGEPDPRREPRLGAQPQQVRAAPLAPGDPVRVGVRVQPGRPPLGCRAHQVQPVLTERGQPQVGAVTAALLGPVPEDHRGVHLAGAKLRQRLRRLGLGQLQPQRGMGGAHSGGGRRDQGAERGRERRQPHRSGPQADVLGEHRLGGLHPADDLLRALGKQRASLGEPHATADPAQQHRAGLRLQARQVMADRRLRIVQRLGRRGHRAVFGHRGQHPQPGQVKHARNLSD